MHVQWTYTYAVSPYHRAEMYAGRAACCSLVSHGEHANGTDEQTDEHQTVTSRFPLWTRPVWCITMACEF